MELRQCCSGSVLPIETEVRTRSTQRSANNDVLEEKQLWESQGNGATESLRLEKRLEGRAGRGVGGFAKYTYNDIAAKVWLSCSANVLEGSGQAAGVLMIYCTPCSSGSTADSSRGRVGLGGFKYGKKKRFFTSCW